MTPPQVHRWALERDRATAEYLRTFHHIDWDAPTLYHLVVNTEGLSLDKVVELIVAAARRLEGTGVSSARNLRQQYMVGHGRVAGKKNSIYTQS